MLQFDQFDNAVIKKEFYKNNIKYIELSYTCTETNKIYLIKISYKRYILQKYLGYLIPKEHHIISLDGNEENYDVYNLGIRDEDNESPVYKGYRIQREYHKTVNALAVILIKGKINSSRNKQIYIYENLLGRRLLTTERVIFKKDPFVNYNIENLKIIVICNLKSSLYEYTVIQGPYYHKKGRLYVNIINSDKRIHLSYPKFLMQEHLGRFLREEETVHHKDSDYYNNEINNLEIINRIDHVSQDTFRLKEQTFICQICGTMFSRSGSQLSSYYTYAKNKPDYVGPFCSFKCSNRVSKKNKAILKNILPDKEFYNLSGTIKKSSEIC